MTTTTQTTVAELQALVAEIKTLAPRAGATGMNFNQFSFSTFPAKFAGKCAGDCGKRVQQHEVVAFNREWGGVMHLACVKAALEDTIADFRKAMATTEWYLTHTREVEIIDTISPEAAAAGLTADNSEACPRCCGCGEYSCNASGDRTCYGCGGLGRVTKAKAARMSRAMVGRGY